MTETVVRAVGVAVSDFMSAPRQAGEAS